MNGVSYVSALCHNSSIESCHLQITRVSNDLLPTFQAAVGFILLQCATAFCHNLSGNAAASTKPL